MSDSDVYNSQEHRLKIVVVGDGASGKTSIITRFAQVQFAKEYEQTVGVDFFSRRIHLSSPQAKNRSFLLEIWDIGGQTIGGPMLDKYVFGAEIVLFVYDISNSESFDDITDWIAAVGSIVQDTECHFVLVGNKADLEHLRVVSKQQHDELAREYHMSSCIVSAKTGESIEALFKKAVAQKLKFTRSSKLKPQAPLDFACPNPGRSSMTTSDAVESHQESKAKPEKTDSPVVSEARKVPKEEVALTQQVSYMAKKQKSSRKSTVCAIA